MSEFLIPSSLHTSLEIASVSYMVSALTFRTASVFSSFGVRGMRCFFITARVFVEPVRVFEFVRCTSMCFHQIVELGMRSVILWNGCRTFEFKRGLGVSFSIAHFRCRSGLADHQWVQMRCLKILQSVFENMSHAISYYLVAACSI